MSTTPPSASTSYLSWNSIIRTADIPNNVNQNTNEVRARAHEPSDKINNANNVPTILLGMQTISFLHPKTIIKTPENRLQNIQRWISIKQSAWWKLVQLWAIQHHLYGTCLKGNCHWWNFSNMSLCWLTWAIPPNFMKLGTVGEKFQIFEIPSCTSFRIHDCFLCAVTPFNNIEPLDRKFITQPSNHRHINDSWRWALVTAHKWNVAGWP